MTITGIEELTKGKCKIYIDEETAFALYKAEIKRFGISEGAELAEKDYEEIMQDILLKRAKRRCLYLLKNMDRTEYQIVTKLKEGFYPEAIIEQAVNYAKGYRYIDDESYTRRYIMSKSASKSRLAIISELTRKGISRQLIDLVYADEETDEALAIERLVRKKNIDLKEADDSQIRKLYQHICRKGFRYEDVERVIRRMTEEEEESF